MPDPCRCNCGYTCGRQCGLPIMECMKVHYEQDCDHVFDGEGVTEEFEGGGGFSSTSCSKCGALAISHDMACGP